MLPSKNGYVLVKEFLYVCAGSVRTRAISIGVYVRILGLLILMLMTGFLCQKSIAASFDCDKARTSAEKMICAYPDLGRADEKLALAYKAAMTSSKRPWKDDIRSDEVKWLSYRNSDFRSEVSKNKTKAYLHDWMKYEIDARVSYLRTISERDKITYIHRNHESIDVCSTVLSKENMIWNGRGPMGDDGFMLTSAVPDYTGWMQETGLTDQAWVKHGEFDFLNDGEKQNIYKVYVSNSHFMYTWYILVAPGEGAVIKRRMKNPDNLVKDLIRVPYKSKWESPFRSANVATWKKEKETLKSRLLDTSSTNLYGGDYTTSEVIRFHGETYVVATGNSGGPTFAIFKPRAPGSLVPLCYYRATPSIIEHTVKRLTKGGMCPYKLKSIDTKLNKNPCSENSAIIMLKEWGGSRPVVEKNHFLGGALCGGSTLMVGDVGKKEVTKNSWRPLSKLAGKSGVFFLMTSVGAYIENVVNPSVKLFSKIENNSLIPVCSVTSRPVDPPGYATDRANPNSW